MPALNDHAIVLRLTDYSETSQIATLFTPACGLVRLIAKGARRSTSKRFSAGLDTLELGDVSYIPAHGDAQLGTLTEWKQRDLFLGLRSALAPLYGGLYAAELITALTQENDPHAGLFEALHQLLRDLAAGAPPARTLARFQAELLAALGFAPVLDVCVQCLRPPARGTPAYFSSSAGGLLCRDCEPPHAEKWRLPPGLLGTTPQTGDPRAWFTVQNYHLTHIAGHPFKTTERLLRTL